MACYGIDSNEIVSLFKSELDGDHIVNSIDQQSLNFAKAKGEAIKRDLYQPFTLTGCGCKLTVFKQHHPEQTIPIRQLIEILSTSRESDEKLAKYVDRALVKINKSANNIYAKTTILKGFVRYVIL